MDEEEKPFKVKIEYCRGCGYKPMYHFVKNEIEKQYPEADIEGIPIPGGTGCFEVKVKEVLLHSKLNGEGRVDMYNMGRIMGKLRKIIL